MLGKLIDKLGNILSSQTAVYIYILIILVLVLFLVATLIKKELQFL